MQALTPTTIVLIILAYFAMLIGVSLWTSRGADNASFFKANQNASWWMVSFGMIGASLSGVTFISVPGLVGQTGANQAFSYLQMVLGYVIGYFTIAFVLLPIYYRYNLTSIYGYLEKRLGVISYKTGAGFFILSRLLGSSLRLFLVSIVIDQFVTSKLGIPFSVTVLSTLALVWLYTRVGGIKTIIVTDVVQTVAMLGGVVLSILFIGQSMELSVGEMLTKVYMSDLSKTFFFSEGWSDPNNFFKQFTSGALIALVMTGLDQDMMQKNLTCKTLGDAQKNILTLSVSLIFSNILFLTLGALLYLYVGQFAIELPEKSDYLFPMLALEYFSPSLGILFVIGLIAAAYSSADSALTSLTTSFCVDFLDIEKSVQSETVKIKTRKIVHISFVILTYLAILFFEAMNDDAVINGIFTVASYTYGPLLGLFGFSILTKRQINDRLSWFICILSPILAYYINEHSAEWFGGFKLGYLILLVNGLLTFIGLYILSINVAQNGHETDGAKLQV